MENFLLHAMMKMKEAEEGGDSESTGSHPTKSSNVPSSGPKRVGTTASTDADGEEYTFKDKMSVVEVLVDKSVEESSDSSSDSDSDESSAEDVSSDSENDSSGSSSSESDSSEEDSESDVDEEEEASSPEVGAVEDVSITTGENIPELGAEEPQTHKNIPTQQEIVDLPEPDTPIEVSEIPPPASIEDMSVEKTNISDSPLGKDTSLRGDSVDKSIEDSKNEEESEEKKGKSPSDLPPVTAIIDEPLRTPEISHDYGIVDESPAMSPVSPLPGGVNIVMKKKTVVKLHRKKPSAKKIRIGKRMPAGQPRVESQEDYLRIMRQLKSEGARSSDESPSSSDERTVVAKQLVVLTVVPVPDGSSIVVPDDKTADSDPGDKPAVVFPDSTNKSAFVPSTGFAESIVNATMTPEAPQPVKKEEYDEPAPMIMNMPLRTRRRRSSMDAGVLQMEEISRERANGGKSSVDEAKPTPIDTLASRVVEEDPRKRSSSLSTGADNQKEEPEKTEESENGVNWLDFLKDGPKKSDDVCIKKPVNEIFDMMEEGKCMSRLDKKGKSLKKICLWAKFKDTRTFYWGDKIGVPKAKNMIPFDELEAAEVGSRVRKGKEKKEKELSFSIFTSKIVLDFVTSDKQEAFDWTRAITLIVASRKRRLFGIPLHEVVLRNGSAVYSGVPHIIVSTTRYILKHGADEEGIMRLSGMKDEIRKLVDCFNTGSGFEIQGITRDVHVVVGVFKLFLRELPEPILCFKNFDILKKIYKDYFDDNLDVFISETKKVVDNLPYCNGETLKVLLKFVSELSKHKEKTKMTAGNLAIVIGPNLLRKKEESMYEAAEHSIFIKILAESLILNADKLFK